MDPIQITRREMLLASGALGLASFTDVLGAAEPELVKKPAAKGYAKAVLAKKPVGYWRLGEARGKTANDSSGNKRAGSYHGKVVHGQAGAIQHDSDKAIKVSGKAYVEVPSPRSKAFSLPTSGKGLTVEVWMRPDKLVFDGETDDPYVYWMGKGEKGKFEWGFRFYSKKSSRPNRISAYIWNPSGGLGAGAYFQDTIKTGQWLLVVATFDPGSKSNKSAGVSIYKNGVLRHGPKTSKGALYSTYKIVPKSGNAPVRFGTRDLGSFLSGGLDEVAIYPRVLTAAEIMENYRAGRA